MGIKGRLVKRRSERGQVAILFALVFTFLFVLFAFVVDFGHVINDKINLQIAADNAAYAGAAWQARQLNRIAMVNYHLRQDLKEFAMRLNVTHLRHNRNFPRGNQFIQGGSSMATVNPWICQQAHGYLSLAGVQYANDTNICRNADPITGGLPPIVVPPLIAGFDPFAVAVIAQIQQIQAASDRECAASADDNRLLAEHLIRVFRNRSNFHAAQMRELANWMNEVAQQDPKASNHALVKTAYQSAIKNLTLSNKDDFTFQILQPRDGAYVKLDEQDMRGTVLYLNFQRSGGGGCVGQPGLLDFDGVPAFFVKDRAIMTYFAVKLTSKPRLFFMPARWTEDAFPKLEAYAVAKPFGSRIGPNLLADQLIPTPNRPGNVSRVVNFSFVPGDTMGIYNTKVMSYLDALHPFNSLGRPDGNQQSGWPDPQKPESISRPLRAIRAPTVFDALLYSVFPDPGANKDADYAEPQYAEVLYPDYLEAADPANNQILQTPNPATPPYLPAAVGSRNRGTGWIQINAPQQGGPNYGTYAEEGISSHSTTGMSDFLQAPAEFGWATKDMINSGWTPKGRPGRVGYSVKFVGMDAIIRTLRVTLSISGGEGPIANPPTNDPNLSQIYH